MVESSSINQNDQNDHLLSQQKNAGNYAASSNPL